MMISSKYRHMRALTNYPVFLLTVISLITITMLATTIIHEELRSRNNSVVEPTIQYIAINNTLYIKTNADPPIKAIYIGGENTTEILGYINGYYGPLKLDKTYKTIIVTGQLNGRPIILDIIRNTGIIDRVWRIINNTYPPSILINPSTNKIQELGELYGAYKYYRLKPYTMVKQLILWRNQAYSIEGNGSIIGGGPPSKLRYNYRVDYAGLNITELILNLTNSYGNITYQQNVTLYNYPHNTYTMETLFETTYNITAKPPVIIEKTYTLDTVNASRPEILEFSIKHITTSISLIDYNGRIYTPWTTIKYIIQLINSNNQRVEEYSITRTIGKNTSDQYIIEWKTLINQTVTIKLTIEYIISTQQIIQSKLLVGQVTYYITPGYSGGIYLKELLTDTLTITTGSYKYIYSAVDNNTNIPVIICSELNRTLDIWINNTNYASGTTILYQLAKPRTYNYSITITPSIEIYTAPNIELETSDPEEIIYMIGNRHYGIYTLSNTSRISIIIHPCIEYGNETIMVEDTNSEVSVLSLGTGEIVYYNGSIITIRGRLELINMFVYDEIIYTNPLLYFIDDYGLNITLNITYLDDTHQIIHVNETELIPLRNMMIKTINITVSPIKNNNVSFYHSTLSNKYIVVFNDELLITDRIKRIVFFNEYIYYIKTSYIEVFFKKQ